MSAKRPGEERLESCNYAWPKLVRMRKLKVDPMAQEAR